MATNDIHLSVSDNNISVPLTISNTRNLRTVTPQNGSPYYVGARAYVTQTASGATVTVIDKEGTTTAVITNGADGQDGADGVGIASIDLTSTVGNVDTYTITYTDGTTDTFDITNGVDGQDGQDGADGADGFSPTATVSKSGDTATITITDKDGTTTATVKDGTQANAFTAEYGITTYADVKDAYDDGAIIICTADDSGNTMVLQLVYFDATNEIFFFAEPNGDGLYWTELSNANGWDDGTRYLASTDVATQLRDGLMSALDWQKLDGIASGAEVNVQSDWNQSTNTADDYIKNKPTIPSNVSDLVNDSGFITSPNVVYCTCGTATSTVAKVATIVSGSLTSLTTGAQAIVKFTYANSATNPTLKVGSTTAKNIKRYGSTAVGTSAASSWNANSCVLFVYDGTDWQIAGWLNSTYSEITAANIKSSSSSSTGLISGRRAKAAVDEFAPVKDVTVGGTSVMSGTTAVVPAIPTDTGDLTNGAGFITGYTETDPVFTASAASGITSSDIDNWDGKQDELVSEVNIRTINGTSVLGSGDISVAAGGTPIPTADTVAEFDEDAHINSEDMSAQDVSDFVDALNMQGGVFAPVAFNLTPNSSLLTSTGQGLFFPLVNTVIVFAIASNGSNMTKSTVLASVPEEYRPSVTRPLLCRFTTDANATSSFTASISASGNIFQSGTGYARSVMVFGIYQL